MKKQNLIRCILSISLTIVMLCSTTVPIFAVDNNDEFVATTSYNPFLDQNNAGTRSIIGDNDFDVIVDPQISPYAAIASLTMVFSCGCGGVGTGFMVSNNCMLTAGHCLICSEHGNGATSINARFGLRPDGDWLVNVTVTPNNAIMYHNPNYTGSQENYDYGYIVFNTNIGNTTGWFCIASRSNSVLNGMNINVTGYRGGVMYDCEGQIKAVTNRRVKYNADTQDGQSGGPVYCIDSTYGAMAVAIHTSGTDLLNWRNSGWRITAEFISELADLGYVTLAN